MRAFLFACLMSIAGVATADTVTQLTAPKSPYADAPFANSNAPYLYVTGMAADGNILGVVRYFGICAGRGCHQPIELAVVEWDWLGNGRVISTCGGDSVKPSQCPARVLGPLQPFVYYVDGVQYEGEIYVTLTDSVGRRAGLWQGTPKSIVLTPDAPASN